MEDPNTVYQQPFTKQHICEEQTETLHQEEQQSEVRDLPGPTLHEEIFSLEQWGQPHKYNSSTWLKRLRECFFRIHRFEKLLLYSLNFCSFAFFGAAYVQ